MYSTAFAPYYDLLMGDYSSIITQTEKLLDKHVPENGKILELGCGTGNILQAFKNRYQLFGLDNSSGMLQIAKKKLPQATYFHADMSDFTIPEKFDAILCIFDSINHLTTFSQWQSLFSSVHKHLKKEGIFIFDMNTIQRLDTLAAMPPYIQKINKDILSCAKVTKIEKTQYMIRFQIFSNINKPQVSYVEESINEAGFPTTKIIATVNKKFVIQQTVDPIRKKITSKTGRIFFVCKRKG